MPSAQSETERYSGVVLERWLGGMDVAAGSRAKRQGSTSPEVCVVFMSMSVSVCLSVLLVGAFDCIQMRETDKCSRNSSSRQDGHARWDASCPDIPLHLSDSPAPP